MKRITITVLSVFVFGLGILTAQTKVTFLNTGQMYVAPQGVSTAHP